MQTVRQVLHCMRECGQVESAFFPPKALCEIFSHEHVLCVRAEHNCGKLVTQLAFLRATKLRADLLRVGFEWAFVHRSGDRVFR